ncbi:MAG TPA: VOC family protein [Candidatus Dormibacteraeota bacterium]|nr:VOC family protein [Candidatus Dormibacteraeota bacterium]
MARVVHFEIHAADPEAAAQFYSTVFGWKVTKWEGPIDYWLVSTGEGRGIDGGIVRRMGESAQPGAAVNAYVCTIGVDSLDETQSAIVANGGAIAVEKHEIPGVGLLAYFKDPDGNIFGMMQPAE